jgi:uncharacterized membrane protein YkvI
MILLPDDLDRLISRALLYMLAGFTLIGVAWIFEIGAVSAINLIGLGAILASVTDYRTERGLWMLAMLYGSLFFVIVSICEFYTLYDFIRGAQPLPWYDALDFAVALHCQWLMVRAMAAVVVYNRQLTNRCS